MGPAHPWPLATPGSLPPTHHGTGTRWWGVCVQGACGLVEPAEDGPVQWLGSGMGAKLCGSRPSHHPPAASPGPSQPHRVPLASLSGDGAPYLHWA